jgi:hypothetical protein
VDLRGTAGPSQYASLLCCLASCADTSLLRPKLEGLARATENRTLLGIVGGIVRDHIPLVDEYHFYSAT